MPLVENGSLLTTRIYQQQLQVQMLCSLQLELYNLIAREGS